MDLIFIRDKHIASRAVTLGHWHRFHRPGQLYAHNRPDLRRPIVWDHDSSGLSRVSGKFSIIEKTALTNV
jgi:hypothetical protein